MLWWFLIPLAALLGYVAGAYRAYRFEQFQNQGETLVRKALIEHLPPDSWHLLNNVTLQLADGTTQIDHVLVSRYGVFVIETKHYQGWIFGDDRSREWTQVIYMRKHRFQNPLRQNYRHLKAVQAVLDFLPPEQVAGLVVFTGEAEFKSNRPSGVYSLDTLVSHLKSLDRQLLSENRMQFCVGRLECNRLALTRETDVEHRASLEARHSKNAL
jgi:restriction system protein